jgi:arginine decarboxylase
MKVSQIQEAREASGIEDWGAGYFGIDQNGSVVCYPTANENHSVALPDVIEQSINQGAKMPLIIRFPQVIKSQLRRMHGAFKKSIDSYNYPGRHFGVFPYKVNQRREFIDAIVSCGKEMDWGLEVGSKTEFMAALNYELTPNSLLICNGFKDSEFIKIAFRASKMQKHVIIVVEGPDELEMIRDEKITLASNDHNCPLIGLRVRLYSKGSGKWEKSSGETSKFGLTTVELINALDLLKQSSMEDQLTMLHFHIGSQITAIKRFKNALKEAARVYAKVIKMGFSPKYLNIGGGVGVDYDGSKTTAQSSANYSLDEFASDAVYVIGEVCKEEGVPCPHIITESGRVIAAYHSVVVTDIREVQGEENLDSVQHFHVSDENIDGYQTQTRELRYILKHMNKKNYIEFYHDALQYNDDLTILFNLGHIDLKERAIVEDMFNKVCKTALYFSSFEKKPIEDFEALQRLKVSKYLANFSIFQSIPDSWAIDQLFPVMPLSRHNERPSLKGTIVDITCDSDGSLENFVDQRDHKKALDLHTPNGDPYYLGFFLVGAYQEALSNEHNLFGATFESEVFINEEGNWTISKVTKGDPIDELLTCRNYNIEEMTDNYQNQLNKSVDKGIINSKQSGNIFEELKTNLQSYPYLDSK